MTQNYTRSLNKKKKKKKKRKERKKGRSEKKKTPENFGIYIALRDRWAVRTIKQRFSPRDIFAHRWLVCETPTKNWPIDIGAAPRFYHATSSRRRE